MADDDTRPGRRSLRARTGELVDHTEALETLRRAMPVMETSGLVLMLAHPDELAVTLGLEPLDPGVAMTALLSVPAVEVSRRQAVLEAAIAIVSVNGWRWRPYSKEHYARLYPQDRVRWIIEIVIDTGQRYQSEDIHGFVPAADFGTDQRRLGRVVAVTLIHAGTGEALQRPSENLVASLVTRRAGHLARATRAGEFELLREALGGH